MQPFLTSVDTHGQELHSFQGSGGGAPPGSRARYSRVPDPVRVTLLLRSSEPRLILPCISLLAFFWTG